ncbi:hypothetical protein [Terriglobus aquaticus]|uniref:Uncharacterized protein n=1 Tax=Terriglobus aquaticus TaxID=940139 RepID=A0ABW9KMX8_9BACT|nr:hypothetical protein [Terriglobus aquaticus]
MQAPQQNYFEYFTEIEDRFQRRRGTLTLLSTLDWALIDAWREAGVPLAAVLRGIDEAFDKYDARAQKTGKRLRKVNGLAWAAQAVMAATEQMKDAAMGAQTTAEPRQSGFEAEPVRAYLQRNAERLAAASLPDSISSQRDEIVARLHTLAEAPGDTEDLERTLTVLEEKLFAMLLLATPEAHQTEWREQAARGLAGSRGMNATQLKHVTQQFLNKRLLERYNVPRLSLFYMEHL